MSNRIDMSCVSDSNDMLTIIYFVLFNHLLFCSVLSEFRMIMSNTCLASYKGMHLYSSRMSASLIDLSPDRSRGFASLFFSSSSVILVLDEGNDRINLPLQRSIVLEVIEDHKRSLPMCSHQHQRQQVKQGKHCL